MRLNARFGSAAVAFCSVVSEVSRIKYWHAVFLRQLPTAATAVINTTAAANTKGVSRIDSHCVGVDVAVSCH